MITNCKKGVMTMIEPSTFRQKVLEFAEYQIGKGEEGINNSGPYIEAILSTFDAEPPANWCAPFIWYCIEQTLIQENLIGSWIHESLKPFKTQSARAMFNVGKRLGWLVENPEPGDLFVQWRESKDSWMGHVGFVFRTPTENFIRTIEGNRGVFPAYVDVFSYPLPIPRLLGYVRFFG